MGDVFSGQWIHNDRFIIFVNFSFNEETKHHTEIKIRVYRADSGIGLRSRERESYSIGKTAEGLLFWFYRHQAREHSYLFNGNDSSQM